MTTTEREARAKRIQAEGIREARERVYGTGRGHTRPRDYEAEYAASAALQEEFTSARQYRLAMEAIEAGRAGVRG